MDVFFNVGFGRLVTLHIRVTSRQSSPNDCIETCL